MTDGPLTFTGLIKFLQYIKGPDHWHYVGETGEPAFANSWVNYNTSTWQGARFIKDASGVVHVEGYIKSGTLAQAAFTLPVGYRPANSLVIVATANTAYARLIVYSNGTVVPNDGNNTRFSIHYSFYVG